MYTRTQGEKVLSPGGRHSATERRDAVSEAVGSVFHRDTLGIVAMTQRYSRALSGQSQQISYPKVAGKAWRERSACRPWNSNRKARPPAALPDIPPEAQLVPQPDLAATPEAQLVSQPEQAAVCRSLAGLNIHTIDDGRCVVPILRPGTGSLPFGMALELHTAQQPSAAGPAQLSCSTNVQQDLYELHYILSGSGQVLECGRAIQELQPGDSVLLSHGRASCRARPGCRSADSASQQSWDMASLIMLLPATLALDRGGSQADVIAATAAAMAACDMAPVQGQLSEEAVAALLASAAAASEPSSAAAASRPRLPDSIRQLLRIGSRRLNRQQSPVLKRGLQELDAFQLPNQTNRLALVFDPLSHAGVPFTFGVEIFTPDHRTSPHQHAVAHELFFILQGTGTGFCNDQRFPVQAGDVIVFPPGSLHGIDNGQNGSMFCLELMLPNDMFAEFVQQGQPAGPLRQEDLCILISADSTGLMMRFVTWVAAEIFSVVHSPQVTFLKEQQSQDYAVFSQHLLSNKHLSLSVGLKIRLSATRSTGVQQPQSAVLAGSSAQWHPCGSDTLSASCASAWKQGPTDPAGRLVQLSDQPLLCSAVSPDGSEAVFGSSDHALYTVDLQACKKSRTLYGRSNGHAEWVSCCKYLPDGRIVSGAMDSKVCVWAAKGVRSQTLEGHSGPIAALDTLSNASGDVLLASASYDKSIHLWQMGGTRSSAASQLTGHKAPILQLKSGGPGLASGDRAGGLAVWDLTAGAASWKAQSAHDGHITALAWAQLPLSSPVATPSNQEHEKAQNISGSAGHDNRVSEEGTQGTPSSAGKKLAGKGLQAFQLTASSSSYHQGNQAAGNVGSSGPFRDPSCLLSGGQDGVLRAWDLRSGAKPVHASPLHVMPTGKLICGGDDGSAICFDLAT
ncbi:hypothetical protein WJX74_010662 [Apatococcus lobatus]|uniref:Cupin type-2 domain-containing protein n=1 Tax=Apatococcus lobatus TaxID=904363 RepID=A0AAW1SH17_9CHLO